jgi:hypothetical protein
MCLAYAVSMDVSKKTPIWEGDGMLFGKVMEMEWPIPSIATPIWEEWLETWLLLLMEQQCGIILMIAWRTWHVRIT